MKLVSLNITYHLWKAYLKVILEKKRRIEIITAVIVVLPMLTTWTRQTLLEVFRQIRFYIA